MATHAPRWRIDESALGIAHQEVQVPTADGRKLSGWYVPSSNGAAVLVSHGSGGSRGRVTAHIRMLARHGYGVLALDDPGNGESEGHSNGLGDNAQPAVDAGVGFLARRPDVDPQRIAGFGLSMGGEVLLEGAARVPRLRAVVSDGAARPADSRKYADAGPLESVSGRLSLQAVRGLSGTRAAPSLFGAVPRITPRPVLLIAGGSAKEEIPTNAAYRAAAGPTAELWAIPDAAHTGGLRTHGAEYERRTTEFLDRALGL
jgi:uncharacterized protein